MAKQIGVESEILKEFGNVLISAEMLTNIEGKIIPTTPSLDIALSGGIAEGTITNIAALPKAGKTTLCLTICANAQKMYKKECYFIDVEGRLRTDLLKTIPGLVWTEEESKKTGIPALQIIRSNEDKFLSAENFMDIMEKLVRSKPGCLIVLDSLAALCPEDEFTKTYGENKKMAGTASLMYRVLRKLAQMLPVTKSTLISITHFQANPGSYSGKVQSGGNAIQYFASTRLEAVSTQKVDSDGIQIGQDTKFRVTASSYGKPGMEGTIYIRYGLGCDIYEDLATIAEELGIIEKGGAWYSFTKPNATEPTKVQGKAKLVMMLQEDNEFVEHIKSQINNIYSFNKDDKNGIQKS